MISADRQSVLTIRSKQVLSSINYWLSIVGYDIHDHSALTLIYLFYLIVFFSAWTLAVMFLVSDFIVNTLSPFLASLGIAFTNIVPAIGMILLMLWSLFSVCKAANRSPLVFSENDAHLLCQTPADRRFITLAWFFGEWPSKVAPVLAIAATVGFALLELDVNNGIKILSAGYLVVVALKPLSIIIPLHIGLFAAVWVVGVYRLQRNVNRMNLMRLLQILALILAVTLFMVTFGSILFPSFFTGFRPLLSFLTFPFDIAFSEGVWGQGLVVSIGLMIISLTLLWQISDKVNLSRAAQETQHFQAQRVALRIGDFDLISEMKDLERLGSMHVPSKIPSFPGSWIMTWKEFVQSQRTMTISRLWSWVVIFLLTFTGIVAGVTLLDSSSFFLLIFYWMLLVGKQTSARFKKDLGTWWLLYSLPLSPRRIILHDIVPPVSVIIFLTWLAMWISSNLGLYISPIIVCSVPFAVAGISFASIFDILRQSDSNKLLEGRTPDFGLVSLFLRLTCIAVPISIYFLINKFSFLPEVGILTTILAGGSLTITLLRLSEKQFKRIG